MKAFLTLLIVFLVFHSVAPGQVQDTTSSGHTFRKVRFPAYTGCVNDFENILTSSQKNKLSKMIGRYERKTTNEIAVVTISSIDPYDNMRDFTMDLANRWGVGKKDIDNGLTIVVSREMREIRITTGSGTEKILTDAICKEVLDKVMLPELKKGQYYTGLKRGIRALIKKWK